MTNGRLSACQLFNPPLRLKAFSNPELSEVTPGHDVACIVAQEERAGLEMLEQNLGKAITFKPQSGGQFTD